MVKISVHSNGTHSQVYYNVNTTIPKRIKPLNNYMDNEYETQKQDINKTWKKKILREYSEILTLKLSSTLSSSAFPLSSSATSNKTLVTLHLYCVLSLPRIQPTGSGMVFTCFKEGKAAPQHG